MNTAVPARARSLRMTSRFVLVLAVLLLSMSAVAAAGFYGLSSSHRALQHLYADNSLHSQSVSDLAALVSDTHISYLELISHTDPVARRHLASYVDTTLIPAIDADLPNTIRVNADNPAAERVAVRMRQDWATFRQTWTAWEVAGSVSAGHGDPGLTSVLHSVTSEADQLIQLDSTAAGARQKVALAQDKDSERLMELMLALGLLAGAGMVLWLIRTVLPRTLEYSRFAARIADGDFDGRLSPSGSDEISQLGRTLDDVAQRRQAAASYDRTQLEFADSLQLTDDEREAQSLLKRHLERSISSSTVTVLNRNNSADRLEAVTTLAADSPLRAGLDGASPRSCLAVRAARSHLRDSSAESLVSCSICGPCPDNSTCTPLLVGGEVIGAVLVNHPGDLDEDDDRRLGESVRQAAPVVANLRNLAIAQLRASTDALTGLPNRRALLDIVKRLVAQSARTDRPLSALMLDLDHFKQINDRFGHSRGDEALAAVGMVLRDVIRGGDFAGRYGGEEFLVLLPDTDMAGAMTLAEKLRAAVGGIRIAKIETDITVSIGVAGMPEHANDGDALERAADRALYAAKTNGRNRVEAAATPDGFTIDELAAF